MKKEISLVIICLLLVMPIAFAENLNVGVKIVDSKNGKLGFFENIWSRITGRVVGGPGEGMGGEGEVYGGPTESEMACMVECTTRSCDLDDMECRTATSGACGNECGVDTTGPPEPADEGEACMQQCIVRGCDGEIDFNCQRANVNTCEDECDMKGDAPDESEMDEEQLCITQCVAAVDSTLICGSGTFEGEGETGNAVCQRCANECVHLYAGPCLTDEKWREKEDACMAQGEHMEAAPVMGDSGQGYECTVDLKCIDRSSEWGDEPGEGPGIGQEGYVAPNVVAGAVDGVIKFFKGLFGGGNEKNPEEPESVEETEE